MANSLGIISELSSFIKALKALSSLIDALSSLIDALSSLDDAINGKNPGICSFTWCWGGGTNTSSDCLPFSNSVQMPQPAKSLQSLVKTFLRLTFRAIVVLSKSLPSSSPPLPTVLFGAAKLVAFVVSLAGLCLQNKHPRIANLLGEISALLVAVGVCIIPSLLVHQNLRWICWLACASILLAFIISFK